MDVVELAAKLVSIPSVTDSRREAEPVRLLTSLLEYHRISYRIFGTASKLNLVATIGRGKPLVMFNSHFDVVPAPQKAFQPQFKNGTMVGRGTADTKGALAAMFTAFTRLSHRPPAKIILCCVCDEENAGRQGTATLAKLGFHAKYHVFGEPTDQTPVIAEKGFLRLKITSLGKEAHAAYPELGVNSILNLSRLITHFRLPLKKHRLLTPPTVCFSTINGGQKINLVPHECQLTLDIRYLPGQDESSLISHISRLSTQIGKFKIEVVSSGPPCATFPNSALVQAAVIETRNQPRGVNFATDARFYPKSDFIVLGPGQPHIAHTPNESVNLSDLKRSAEIYLNLVLRCI